MRSVQLTSVLLSAFALVISNAAAPARPIEVAAPAAKSTPEGAPTSRPAGALDLDACFDGFDGCFVLLDVTTGETSRYHATRCAERFSPCSTFKITNAMIGLETGVVTGPDHLMKWDGTRHRRKACNRNHTLASAIHHSVVWYFQRLATEVGAERMQAWLDRFDYGNRDISAGLTTFWLGNSLRISADEQAGFLARFQRGELPISDRTRDLMRNMLIDETRETSAGVCTGFILRGKTGSQADKTMQHAILGWYVGVLELKDSVYAFACNISAKSEASGMKARDITRRILVERVIEPNGHVIAAPGGD